MFQYKNAIFRGLSLTFLIFLLAYGLTGLLTFLGFNFLGLPTEVPAIEAQSYNWNFSSGLTLSQGFEDQRDNLLTSTAFVHEIASTCKPNCGKDFSFSSTQLLYYDFNVTGINLVYLTDISQWLIEINRHLTTSSHGSFRYYSETIPENNLSSSLVADINQIENFREVNEDQFNSNYYSSIEVGVSHYFLFQTFDSGYQFQIELIQDQLFFSILQFDRYKAWGPGSISLESDDEYQNRFFIATLDQFFPFYTASLNGFLSVFFGV